MTNDQVDAINRLRAWIENYGHAKQPEFIRDLTTILDMVTVNQWSEPTMITGTIDDLTKIYDCANIADKTAIAELCEFHERDGSYVCDYCKAQGKHGHMQGVME